MALTRIAYPSPNYSSRGGAGVRLLTLHTTEGSRTIESLGSWFAQASTQASSHAGADDKVNTIGGFVKRADKAWTACDYNPIACQIECCGFASWTAADWAAHPNLLQNVASWLAEESAAFGIPLVRLSAAEAQGSGRGVCDHAALGAGGCGHWDV